MSNTEILSTNPLLKKDGLPAFGEIEVKHIIPAVDYLIEEVERRYSALENSHEASWEGLIKPLESLDVFMHRVQSPIGHLLGVQNSPELREAHEQVLPKLVQLGLRLQQSEKIFKSLTSIRNSSDWEQLSEVQQRIIEAKLLEATLSGIGLEGEKKERFNALLQELSQIQTKFSNNVLDATKAYSLLLTEKAETEGLPKSALEQGAQAYNQSNESESKEDTKTASAENGPWKITLDGPSLISFLKYSARGDLREQIYKAYISRASSGELDNQPLILNVLQLRKEMATLLGYSSYAEVSLARKMADSVEAVEGLLKELREASLPAAKEEMIALSEFAEKKGASLPLKNWDVSYWSEKLREEQYSFSEEELKPYFPQPKVLEGLFSLLNKLFEVEVIAADEKAPKWHPDVQYYEIKREQKTIAGFYFDPYTRPKDKRGGAWMDDCLSRCIVDGKKQLPVAYLVCNSTKPVGDKPSLLTFNEVQTLFHEFGHGLQHMLTEVDELDASGINGVEWDAVELPSQFMENWCYHKPTLLSLTRHVETGEVLPDHLFEKLLAARTYRSGWGMLRQLRFGLLDMELHHRYEAAEATQSVFELDREIAKETLPMMPLKEDRFLCSFQHIFAGGYAAGYYSYKWAEVLSADAFGAFEDAGLDNAKAVSEIGRKFRDTVLGLGGGRHPMKVFKDFRGREPDTKALLKHSGLLSNS